MPETLKIENKMNVHITSPIETVLDGIADQILLPTVSGPVVVLWNRAPSFIATCPGLMWVYNKGERPQAYYVSAGIAEIRRNICSVLGWGVSAGEIDKSVVHERRLRLESQYAKIHSASQKKILMELIDFLKILETKPSLLTPPEFE